MAAAAVIMVAMAATGIAGVNMVTITTNVAVSIVERQHRRSPP